MEIELSNIVINPFGAATGCKRQNLTYVDIRFEGLRPGRTEKFAMAADSKHRYSNEAEKLTKIFLMISNPFGLHGLYKNISAL